MKSSRKECRMARRELATAAGGDATSAVDAAVQTHVDGCRECRAFAEDCVALAAIVRQEAVDERLVMRLARSGRARALEPRSLWEALPRWTLPALSASLSAAAVILVLGLWGTSPTRPQSVARAPENRVVEPHGEQPVQSLDRLAALLLVRTTAVEATIPADLAALRERALVRRLRGDARNGSQETRPPTSREVNHEQR